VTSDYYVQFSMTTVTFCTVTPSWATPNHEGKGSKKLGGAEDTNYIAEPAASDKNNGDNNEFAMSSDHWQAGSSSLNAAATAAAVDNNADDVEDPTIHCFAISWPPYSTRTQIPLDSKSS
jgi:hypothetical protein